jgi:integrase
VSVVQFRPWAPFHSSPQHLFTAPATVLPPGRVCAKAKLKDVTPHVLRHTFASVAGDLGFSELTIAGLLGHSARGVTQGYVHLDTALIVAADRVSVEIAHMLGRSSGGSTFKEGFQEADYAANSA